MKRIISLVLAVILCVLTLGGCEEVNHENLSTESESSASPSTEEDGRTDSESNTESEDSSKPVLMSGDFIELDVHEEIKHTATEAGGAIICCTQDGKVYVFDSENGKQRYTFQTENIQQVEKALDRKGFDYRIMTASAVLYRNSADPSLEFNLALPECVAKCEETRPHEAQFYYDLSGDKIVYSADDGIYICNADGNEEHLLVSSDNLPTFGEYYGDSNALKPSIANLPLAYVCPKFVCDGKKVAVKVFSSADGMCAGFAVFDSGTGEEIFLKKSPMDSNYQYPVLGNCVAYKINGTAEIYSMETGEKVDEIKSEKGFRTADYNKSAYYSYNLEVYTDQNYKGLEIYSFSEDGSGKLIAKSNNEVDSYITALTENYALVHMEYDAKIYLCAVPIE